MSIGCVAVLLAVETMSRRIDTRGLAVIAAIAAIDSALRLAVVTGIGGFSPMFLLILCAGYAMGAEFGFLCGATTLLVSALVTAGVGPWLPYEMIAAGWVGAAAGLAGAAVAVARHGAATWSCLRLSAWSPAMRTARSWTSGTGRSSAGPPISATWPDCQAGAAAVRFAHFYAATSLVYDSFRAAGNAVLVAILATPVLGALVRLRRRHTVVIEERDRRLRRDSHVAGGHRTQPEQRGGRDAGEQVHHL